MSIYNPASLKAEEFISGEGKAPVGHSGPLTPWGKPALGYKTRKKHNKTDKYIVKREKVFMMISKL